MDGGVYIYSLFMCGQLLGKVKANALPAYAFWRPQSAGGVLMNVPYKGATPIHWANVVVFHVVILGNHEGLKGFLGYRSSCQAG
jgi:hypothetical protein